METKNRKNKLLRIAGLLFLIGMMTSFALTGTLAKYTASATGTSTASIAKFSVKVAGTDIASGSSLTIDLFKTVRELDASGNVTGTSESTSDVADGTIAPGTGGYFDIFVVNMSDVKVLVAYYRIFENLNGVPIQWSIDNTRWTVAPTALSSIVTSDGGLTISAGDTRQTLMHRIYWRWPFSGSDSTDTALGIAGGTVSVTIEFIAQQVD